MITTKFEKRLKGSGPPSATVGLPGDTYVDVATGALYWKSEGGWNPK